MIPLYFCWITVPTLLGQLKSNKDNEFSALLPVTRRSIVAARILSFVILELIHIAGVGLFTIIHGLLYDIPNFGLDLGVGYLGVVFVIYSGFNIALFPLYYRKTPNFGVPLILANVAALLVSAVAEALVQISPVMSDLLENRVAFGLPVLAVGILIYALTGYLAYRISARRFEAVQL